MTIINSVNTFLDYIEKIKRFSPQTLRAYKSDLYQFISFCEYSSKVNIESISEKLLRNYLMILNEQKLSTASISRKLSAIRSMYDFLLKHDYISADLTKKITGPKIKRNLPEIISFDEFQKIPSIIEEEKRVFSREEKKTNNNSNSYLDKAIIELLYSCALRVSELCSLTFGDIDFDRKSVRVLGKGLKVRIVPIGNEPIKILKEYLSEREHLKNNSSLFISPSGIKIYPKYVYKIVNKYLSKVSDIKRKSPHVLRHSAATHMLDRGADLLAVKEILGHENLSTTQIYTHVSVEHLKKIYKQAHPKS
jgi:integrase/recombinase XerC